MKTKFDLSNLYDLFCSREDCWFICCDINSLIPINNISRKAGDLAILESMKRLDDVAGDNDLVFRIGGDEFVILTDSPDEESARAKLDRILSGNGECIDYEGQKIPLSLYGCIVKLEKKTTHMGDLFSSLWQAILDCKNAG